MNTEPNEPEFAAAFEKLKSRVAARYQLVFNEAVLDYAKKEYRTLRASKPARTPDEAVIAAVTAFPESKEGNAYCEMLVQLFIDRYNVFVEKRLRWASNEGLVPDQYLKFIQSMIAVKRMEWIAENPLGFDLGNPRAATPETVAEQARAQAFIDVDTNLGSISAALGGNGDTK